MKKEALFVLIIAFASVIVFRQSFSNFFTQDDFILTAEFSQNNLVQDIDNVFGPPRVTHWRPLHNLYFLITGNIFGRNYFGYHLLSFVLHLLTAFLIYKVTFKIIGDLRSSVVASFIYAVHPAHFVSLFWISGGATTIGLLLLLLSIYFYIYEKRFICVIFYICALLASESMIVGLLIFLAYEFLLKRKKSDWHLIKIILALSLLFLTVRLSFLTPQSTYGAYKIELSWKVFASLKFYILRILGFSETGGDLLVSIALLGWLFFVGVLLLKTFWTEKNLGILQFYLSIIILGFFPFILIPNLLSAHYMSVSIFGFASIVGIVLSKVKMPLILTVISVFFLVAVINVNKIYNNNWVVERANIAKKYIQSIASSNIVEGSTIVFNDNYISTSYDAYIALGTGKAIDFWFEGKNYQYCFTVFESCEDK